MQKKRKSFVFYESFFELFSLVKKSARWPLFEALCMYAFEGVEIELPTQLQAIMSAIKPQIDACNRRYERAKKRAKDTASEDEITPVNEGKNDSQIACKNACKSDDTNTPLNVNDKENVNVNENENAPSRPTPSRPTRGNTRGKKFSSNSSMARARFLDSRAAFDLFYAERRSRFGAHRADFVEGIHSGFALGMTARPKAYPQRGEAPPARRWWGGLPVSHAWSPPHPLLPLPWRGLMRRWRS